MATRTLAYIAPDVLRWARESTGYSVVEAAQKIGIRWWRLEAAEVGADLLTLRQAEKAADTYERPLAALFREQPPEEDPPEVQFRRLPGAPALPWSPAMRLLSRRVRARQEAASELRETLDALSPWPRVARELAAAGDDDLAAIARRHLGISREMQVDAARGDLYAPFRTWRAGLEELGVLVMQDGTMSTDEMRGFASVDSVTPAVVANVRDDPRARAFTIIHELGHLVLASRGEAIDARTEPWCNAFASEIVMPSEWFAQAFERSDGLPLLRRVEAVARSFGVTPLASAVRVAGAELAPDEEIQRVILQIQARGRSADEEEGGGGNYYRNRVAGLGPGFIRLVFSALDANAVTYPTASALLGNVKAGNFERLRATAEGRAEVD